MTEKQVNKSSHGTADTDDQGRAQSTSTRSLTQLVYHICMDQSGAMRITIMLSQSCRADKEDGSGIEERHRPGCTDSPLEHPLLIPGPGYKPVCCSSLLFVGTGDQEVHTQHLAPVTQVLKHLLVHRLLPWAQTLPAEKICQLS